MLYIRDHKEIARVLWESHGDHMFKIRCHKMIEHAFFPKQIFQESEKQDTLYHIAFMTGGHMALVNCWINHDCSYDIEELTLLIYKLMYGEFNV
jgi:hypothetical protein